MFIEVKDVIKRRDNLSSKIPVRESVSSPRLYDDKEEKFFANNAISAIENTRNLHESFDKAVDKSIDIFYEMILNGVNESQLNTSFAIIMENIDKVRDANALINSIKHKNSRFKSKIGTKISNKIDAAKSAIGNSTQNIFSKIAQANPMGSKPAVPAKEESKEESVYYTMLMDKCKYLNECDRILSNYEALSNRINLENCIDEESAYCTAANIANEINKLNILFINKYNSCLETTHVLLASKFINHEVSDIINGTTDYFLFNSRFHESDVSNLVNKSVLYKPSDFSGLYYTKPEAIKESSYGFDLDEYIIDHQMFIENELADSLKKKGKDLKDEADKTVKNIKKAAEEKDPETKKNNKLHDMMQEFRSKASKEVDKDHKSAFKALLTKFFAGDAYHIANEMVTVFDVLRATVIVGMVAIHPIVGLVSFITDQILKVHFTRDQYEKVINAYKKEITKAVKKEKSLKDEKEKEKYQKYIELLKKDLEKIRMNNIENYTDDENDNRDAYGYEDNYGEEPDDDFGLDDSEWDVELESGFKNIIACANKMESIHEGLIDKDVDGVISNNILRMDPEDMDNAVDFIITVPDIIHEGEFRERAEDKRAVLRQNKDADSTLKVDKINDSIRKMKDMKKKNPDEEPLLSESLINLHIIDAIVNYNEQTLLEMDFSNTVKIAMNNMKKATEKLSGKEKEASRNIDLVGENISRGIDNALKTNNREAVIKGKLIPSMSKAIKIALGLGAAWIVNPAIAIVGAIGGFICMNKMQDKERQLLLDDIEVEIKMCERYISKEENNGNLKKVREYERLLRSLQRQQQRIKYKMNVEHNMRAPSADAKPRGIDED